MRSWIILFFLLSALLPLAGAGPAAAGDAPTVAIEGNRLVDGNGAPLRLLGVNRSGAEFACVQGWGIFDGPTDDASIEAMASWNVNAVRVPFNQSCWLGTGGVKPEYSGDNYRRAIKDFVGRLHDAGFIVILDLHWTAPGDEPATGQRLMADADNSPDLWRSVASWFADDPGVIFDLFNEPHDISWGCWRDGCTTSEGWRAAGMQELVDAVRTTSATQPILLSGNGWGGDLSKWLEYRPHDPQGQLAAGFHLYNFSGCNTSACWDETVAPVAASVPVVTGELGENDCASDFIEGYMDWADARGISYLGWTWNTWDCRTGPALISSYDGTPTAFGAGLQRRLAALTPSPSCPAARSRFHAYSTSFTGGVFVASGDVDGDGCDEVVTGAGAGGGPHVRVFSASGRVLAEGFVYGRSMTSGVRVATGDVDGDGSEEVITGPGAGASPLVKVFDVAGAGLNLKYSFHAYNPAFLGGVFVTAGDVNGGRDEVITGAGRGGGPHVRVFSGTRAVAGFFPYPTGFTGGVRVASVEADGDQAFEIVTGAGPGGGPHVKVWDLGSRPAAVGGFMAYDAGFPGGVFVAGGRGLTGREEIVTGAGGGGGPHVRAWKAVSSRQVYDLMAYGRSFRGGVRVAVISITGGLVTAPGPGSSPELHLYQ